MDDNALQTLLAAFDGNKQWEELIQKLDKGFGAYSEVDSIAELVGDEIARQLLLDYSDELLNAYARAGHELVVAASEVAQRNLNDAARIGIKPKVTRYPKARVKALADALDAVDAERLPKEIKDAVPSLVMSMADDIVKYNADFQANSGLTPVIVRTWSGSYPSHDTKHTDWCHDLAGTYEYGKEPNRVYARHKGCRCKVEYFPNARAKGRITALSKGEVDRSGVLWNTRADTLGKRLRKQK